MYYLYKMPKVICPDCKLELKKQRWTREGRGFKFRNIDMSIRMCPAGDTVTRRYCEDCAFNHLQLISDIFVQSFENPENDN